MSRDAFVVVTEPMPEQTVYGVFQPSNDRTVAQDIPALSKKYKAVILKRKKRLPYFVVSRDYDEQSGDFTLFTGGLTPHERLSRWVLPQGLYARMLIQPKFGFLWGPAIGEAKRYFYREWLPLSKFRSLNMEYEYHTKKSRGLHPYIMLYFALQ